MSIHAIEDPCWVVVNRHGDISVTEVGYHHYRDDAEWTANALNEAPEAAGDAPHAARHNTTPCVAAYCDRCGDSFGGEVDSTTHFESMQFAAATIPDHGWWFTHMRDPIICETCLEQVQPCTTITQTHYHWSVDLKPGLGAGQVGTTLCGMDAIDQDAAADDAANVRDLNEMPACPECAHRLTGAR